MTQEPTNPDVARPGRYRFGDVEVDVPAHTLKRGGEFKATEPKAFAVLLVLLQRPGELVPHDDLLDAVWGHRHVTPGVLTRAIAQLRHALGDDPQHPRYIQTRHALGYSFVGELLDDAPAPSPIDVAPDSTDSAAAAGAIAADIAASATTDGAAGNHPHHWRLRHWLFASLIALAITGFIAGKEWFDRTTVRARPSSIAVMPFTTLGDDREDRYFAEGLSMELLHALASLPGLKVAAWRPAEAIDRTLDVRELGKSLGVEAILDANVGREGERLRISARLSDSRTGYTIWSRTYDRDVVAVFDTQSEIAREVAQSLLGVLPDAGAGLERRLTPTRNVAAFDAYLVGLAHALHPNDPAAREAAEVQFRKALAEDSGFARAQAQLCRVELWSFETHRNPDAFEGARLACNRAANMDRSIGEVDLALGDLYRVKGDQAKAMEHYDRLLNDPALRASALVGRGQVYVDQGDEEHAMEQFRRALEASPGDAQVHAELGYQQYRLGRYADAVDSYRQAVALRPDRAAYWSIYGALLLAVGDDAAESALMRALDLEPNASALSNLGEIRYQAGDYRGAAELFRQAAHLNPAKYAYIGYLGDALRADPETAGEAPAAYAAAAVQAQQFVDMKPDDAIAVAMLGWYRANLGEHGEAGNLAKRAESLKLEPGEVAFYGARTYALLGESDKAQRRLEEARAAGVSERRIMANRTLIEAGLVAESPRQAQ